MGDRFPTTQIDLLTRLLRDGESGLEQARSHVMSVYAQPLAAYIAASSFRDLGDPDDLVWGFIASRLSKREFLHDWHATRRPLRYWLLASLKNYLHEQARADTRWRRGDSREPDRAPALTPEDEFQRAAATALVRAALDAAAAACEQRGLSDHWHAFMLRRVRGVPTADAAVALGVAPPRLAVMERAAASRFRSVIREMLAWGGADAEDINAEVRALMAALHGGA